MSSAAPFASSQGRAARMPTRSRRRLRRSACGGRSSTSASTTPAARASRCSAASPSCATAGGRPVSNSGRVAALAWSSPMLSHAGLRTGRSASADSSVPSAMSGRSKACCRPSASTSRRVLNGSKHLRAVLSPLLHCEALLPLRPRHRRHLPRHRRQEEAAIVRD